MSAWDILDNINKARGMGSTDQCYNVLYTVARAFNVKTVIGIGTHRGASAIVMAQAILDNGYIPEIHTIDNYRMYTDTKREDIKEQAILNIKDAGFAEKVHIYDGYSGEVLPELFRSYLKRVRKDSYDVISFPTKYVEGDGHLVGITLAHRCWL